MSQSTANELAEKVFTIADAIARYESGEMSSQFGGIQTLVNKTIEHGSDDSIPNYSYLEALFLTELMLRNANHKINIVTGCACDRFYSTLFVHLTDAIKRVNKNGGDAKILIESDTCPKWMEALAGEFEDSFQIGFKPDGKLAHFIVCDSKIVRLEEPHGKLSLASAANEIKAKVFFSNPEEGSKLEISFQELWSDVKINKPSGRTDIRTAPSWLIHRTEAARNLPKPTSEQVDSQMKASAAIREKSLSKLTV
jgi:hypothetical protein